MTDSLTDLRHQLVETQLCENGGSELFHGHSAIIACAHLLAILPVALLPGSAQLWSDTVRVEEDNCPC